jgi:hypothetical protein
MIWIRISHKGEGTLNSLGNLFLAYTLFGFDLTPDMSEVGAFQLIKQGKIPVETHFVEALKVTINVVLYAEFDNDRNRQVLFITCFFKVGL